MAITHIALSHSLLWPSLRSLSLRNWLIVIFALLAGGLVKGVVSIGVPLIAIPLLTGILSVNSTDGLEEALRRWFISAVAFDSPEQTVDPSQQAKPSLLLQ
jgi:hypothetical protein